MIRHRWPPSARSNSSTSMRTSCVTRFRQADLTHHIVSLKLEVVEPEGYQFRPGQYSDRMIGQTRNWASRSRSQTAFPTLGPGARGIRQTRPGNWPNRARRNGTVSRWQPAYRRVRLVKRTRRSLDRPTANRQRQEPRTRAGARRLCPHLSRGAPRTPVLLRQFTAENWPRCNTGFKWSGRRPPQPDYPARCPARPEQYRRHRAAASPHGPHDRVAPIHDPPHRAATRLNDPGHRTAAGADVKAAKYPVSPPARTGPTNEMGVYRGKCERSTPLRRYDHLVDITGVAGGRICLDPSSSLVPVPRWGG